MFKVIYPMIFLIALELTPVVKVYANIKEKYGQNFSHLTSQVSTDEKSASEALSNKLSNLENFENLITPSAKTTTELNAWF